MDYPARLNKKLSFSEKVENWILMHAQLIFYIIVILVWAVIISFAYIADVGSIYNI